MPDLKEQFTQNPVPNWLRWYPDYRKHLGLITFAVGVLAIAAYAYTLYNYGQLFAVIDQLRSVDLLGKIMALVVLCGFFVCICTFATMFQRTFGHWIQGFSVLVGVIWLYITGDFLTTYRVPTYNTNIGDPLFYCTVLWVMVVAIDFTLMFLVRHYEASAQ